MATAKKTTVKKTSTTKKTPAKKVSTVQKAPVKKVSTSKKSSVKSSPKVRSFHVSPNIPTFITFKLTRQTVYWVILVAYIIFLQLWIIDLQLQTSSYIEDEISSTSQF